MILLHFALILLHFVLVLHFAAIVITFCVSITFCGDYYILRRNTLFWGCIKIFGKFNIFFWVLNLTEMSLSFHYGLTFITCKLRRSVGEETRRRITCA